MHCSRSVAVLLVTATVATAFHTASAEEAGYREARASLGAMVTKGNTDTERYNATIDFRNRTERNRYTAGLELNRGKTEGEEDVHNSRVFARYDRFLRGPWYWDVHTSALQDKERDLRYRAIVGTGAGYQFFDHQALQLSVELGPSYVRQRRYDEDQESETTTRWALDYRQTLNDGLVQLFHNHEVVVPTDESDGWFASARSGIRVPLRRNLSASLQLNYDYDNDPPPETKRYDSVTLLNLAYEW